MSYRELGELLLYLGVADGVNLDGGGSTTMLVHHELKNSPSDGSERAVVNGLLAISTAPDGELAHIQIEPDVTETRYNGTKKFRTTGWDDYYNPVPVGSESLDYEVDSRLGTITSDGEFTARANGAEGYIYVRRGDLVDSAYVYIKAIKAIELTPQFCVTDTVETIVFNLHAVDEDGKGLILPNEELQWESANPAVGIIEEAGRFRGLMEGSTRIYVQFGEMTDSAEVRVEVGTDQRQLDDMDSGFNWQLDGQNIDTAQTVLTVVDSPRAYGDASFKVDYQFIKSATEYPWLYLNTDIAIYGVPDYIRLDFCGDGNSHKVYVIASDNNGELFRASVRPFQRNMEFETIAYSTSSFQPVDEGSFHYPIRIKSIEVKLGSSVSVGDTSKGTLYFDNLRISYPVTTGIEEVYSRGQPREYQLYQNYPNPFNPVTRIPFYIPEKSAVTVRVYNVLGQKIAIPFQGFLNSGYHVVRWNASGYSSGVYIFELYSKNKQIKLRKKMILLN
jgi:hypothetical protein